MRFEPSLPIRNGSLSKRQSNEQFGKRVQEYRLQLYYALTINMRR